jgi:hypothetical protein
VHRETASEVSDLKTLLRYENGYQLIDFGHFKQSVFRLIPSRLRHVSEEVHKIWLREDTGCRLWADIFFNGTDEIYIKPLLIFRSNESTRKRYQ